MVDEYDPLWLEFLQSLNTVDNNSTTQQTTTQSNVTFDSLFSEDDDDDEEFIGPDDENNIENADERKLRVSSMFNRYSGSWRNVMCCIFQNVN